MKLRALFRRTYPTVPISCDGADFALQTIAASRTRHGDLEWTYEAERAGVFARLTRQGRLGRTDAEDWIGRWEREAEARGVSRSTVGFWDLAWDWIAEQRRT
jgi:hypothetical protein